MRSSPRSRSTSPEVRASLRKYAVLRLPPANFPQPDVWCTIHPMMLSPTTRLLALPLLASTCGFAQDGITIRVNAAEIVGPYKPISGYFGYDEPNYTYAKYGRKLIGELANLGGAPVYIRTHFMLATGDGTPGFKFGSTNAYTEDASGKPMYDWTITDRIIDTYLQAGARPFVEIGFMPQALSS